MVEPASTLLSHRLPELHHIRGTDYPSVNTERLSEHHMHTWYSFQDDILAACNTLDLSDLVSVSDATEGERYVVGNERGLSTRIVSNICDPVTRALSVTNLSNLRFADIQAASSNPSETPGVVLLSLDRLDATERRHTTILGVGEYKPMWTLDLHDFPITSPHGRRGLEPFIGQVVSYMREGRVRYGFITTYEATVFIKRTADFRFEVSTPIDQNDTNPTVRECFLGFCVLASADGSYFEPLDFDPRFLRCPNYGAQASLFPHPERNNHQQQTPLNLPSICSRSIAFGHDGRGDSLVNCVRVISDSPTRKVFEVLYEGARAVAKCWVADEEENWGSEAWVYQQTHESRATGDDVFCKIINHGEIACSSVFPRGYILVISIAEGEPLNTIWDELTVPQKNHVRVQCRKAISILRSKSIWIADIGKQNVLFSRKTNAVTMVDFESMGLLDPGETPDLDAPEMLRIFGGTVMREPICL